MALSLSFSAHICTQHFNDGHSLLFPYQYVMLCLSALSLEVIKRCAANGPTGASRNFILCWFFLCAALAGPTTMHTHCVQHANINRPMPLAKSNQFMPINFSFLFIGLIQIYRLCALRIRCTFHIHYLRSVTRLKISQPIGVFVWVRAGQQNWIMSLSSVHMNRHWKDALMREKNSLEYTFLSRWFKI